MKQLKRNLFSPQPKLHDPIRSNSQVPLRWATKSYKRTTNRAKLDTLINDLHNNKELDGWEFKAYLKMPEKQKQTLRRALNQPWARMDFYNILHTSFLIQAYIVEYIYKKCKKT